MTKTVFSKEKLNVSYDEEKNFFEVELSHEHHETEDFKNDLLKFLDLAAQYKPVAVLWNLSKFEILIPPGLQEWIDITINKKEIELGVKREAFVVQDDLSAEMSVEQSMEESHGSFIGTKIFTDYDAAVKWLLG